MSKAASVEDFDEPAAESASNKFAKKHAKRVGSKDLLIQSALSRQVRKKMRRRVMHSDCTHGSVEASCISMSIGRKAVAREST
jgi:hypothetical protein